MCFFSDSRVLYMFTISLGGFMVWSTSLCIASSRQHSQLNGAMYRLSITWHTSCRSGCRSLPVTKLSSRTCLVGQDFLFKPTESSSLDPNTFDLRDRDSDIEVRPLLTSISQTPHSCYMQKS
ncbi:hypothetical protein XENOCAPTIV_021735 [Xenoophorus captivus]|uniref:Secreted protein n=1 Tax=Xenoophorus captivus TaxID=1517983 RepID=A0ABV0RB86_9TELE